jgi:anti-anti-sigma regulatory factor
MTTAASRHRWSTLLNGWSHDWGGFLALALLPYSLLHVSWLITRWGAVEAQTAIGDLFWIPVNLAVIALTIRAATHTILDRQTRRAWAIITVSQTWYLLGNLLFLYYDLRGDAPYPSLADVAYLCSYPFLLWGILSFPVTGRGRDDRWTFWLDASTVLVGGTMLVWHLILRPTTAAEYSNVWELAVSVAYPVADLLTLFGIAWISLRRPQATSRTALMLFSAGLFSSFVADLGYGYLVAGDGYQAGDWPDFFWMSQLCLLALSAHVQYWFVANTTPNEQNVASNRVTIVPYIAVSLAYGLLLLSSRDQWTTPLGTLIIGALVLTSLVVARQVVSVRATERARAEAELATQALAQANLQLEQRVAERTATLSEALAVQEAQAKALQESLDVQQQLNATIATLSVPIIPINDDVLVVPLVGTIDIDRTRVMLATVLERIEATRARKLFLDVTGVAVIDQVVAQSLLQTARAARLLGTETVLVGMRPDVAQALVALGADLDRLRTAATLQAGLADLKDRHPHAWRAITSN